MYIPTFWRNILSSSSGLKWGCWEVGSLYRVRRRTTLEGGKLASHSQEMRSRWHGLIGSYHAGKDRMNWPF
jgi:hypothetical protein